MKLEELRRDLIMDQKKGLPFITASVVTWFLIMIVCALGLNMQLRNLLVFVASAPMVPIAWMVGKHLGVDIFSEKNPLSQAGMLFTMNHMLYILIVMWVFNAVPEKMVMVYGMVFGAHFLPYSWLYDSKAYKIFAIIIPIIALVLGNIFNGFVVAAALFVLEVIFVFLLNKEVNEVSNQTMTTKN